MRETIIKNIATFFGIGYLPWWPGTWASAAAVGLFFFLTQGSAKFFFGAGLFATVVLMAAGFAASGKAEKIFRKKDSSKIVIDEVAAMAAVLVFIPQHVVFVAVAFIFFRLFDIFKPYPAKKIQQISGSWGIMGDDIIAALYTLASVWIFSSVIRR